MASGAAPTRATKALMWTVGLGALVFIAGLLPYLTLPEDITPKKRAWGKPVPVIAPFKLCDNGSGYFTSHYISDHVCSILESVATEMDPKLLLGLIHSTNALLIFLCIRKYLWSVRSYIVVIREPCAALLGVLFAVHPANQAVLTAAGASSRSPISLFIALLGIYSYTSLIETREREPHAKTWMLFIASTVWLSDSLSVPAMLLLLCLSRSFPTTASSLITLCPGVSSLLCILGIAINVDHPFRAFKTAKVSIHLAGAGAGGPRASDPATALIREIVLRSSSLNHDLTKVMHDVYWALRTFLTGSIRGSTLWRDGFVNRPASSDMRAAIPPPAAQLPMIEVYAISAVMVVVGLCLFSTARSALRRQRPGNVVAAVGSLVAVVVLQRTPPPMPGAPMPGAGSGTNDGVDVYFVNAFLSAALAVALADTWASVTMPRLSDNTVTTVYKPPLPLDPNPNPLGPVGLVEGQSLPHLCPPSMPLSAKIAFGSIAASAFLFSLEAACR